MTDAKIEQSSAISKLAQRVEEKDFKSSELLQLRRRLGTHIEHLSVALVSGDVRWGARTANSATELITAAVTSLDKASRNDFGNLEVELHAIEMLFVAVGKQVVYNWAVGLVGDEVCEHCFEDAGGVRTTERVFCQKGTGLFWMETDGSTGKALLCATKAGLSQFGDAVPSWQEFRDTADDTWAKEAIMEYMSFLFGGC